MKTYTYKQTTTWVNIGVNWVTSGTEGLRRAARIKHSALYWLVRRQGGMWCIGLWCAHIHCIGMLCIGVLCIGVRRHSRLFSLFVLWLVGPGEWGGIQGEQGHQHTNTPTQAALEACSMVCTTACSMDCSVARRHSTCPCTQ